MWAGGGSLQREGGGADKKPTHARCSCWAVGGGVWLSLTSFTSEGAMAMEAWTQRLRAGPELEGKSVVEGERGDVGGRRIITKRGGGGGQEADTRALLVLGGGGWGVAVAHFVHVGGGDGDGGVDPALEGGAGVRGEERRGGGEGRCGRAADHYKERGGGRTRSRHTRAARAGRWGVGCGCRSLRSRRRGRWRWRRGPSA